MSQPPNPTLTIRLKLEQINAVLMHLHRGIYQDVAPTIGEITEQSEAQLAELRAPRTSAAVVAPLPATQTNLPGTPPAPADNFTNPETGQDSGVPIANH